MVTFQTFEDIQVWQKARILTHEIYTISSHGQLGKDFRLREQIRKASVSIISNIAEGFERDGGKKFIQFLAIAKGSVGEVRSRIYIAFD